MGAGASAYDNFDAAKADGKTDEDIAAFVAANRSNVKLENPAEPVCRICVVQFKVSGHPNGGSDKGPDGNRVDSIPIANGCVKAGAFTEMFLFNADDADASFAALTAGTFDAYIVRINPGQLSQGTPEGTQAKFDAFMRSEQEAGKLVWSSPDVQTKMGAKDALCKISEMGCGLVDTFAYYDAMSLEEHFKKTAAFQPRVIKQNRGSAGEGIWLVWLLGKDYCPKFGDASLEDGDKLKLMEMNDNHIEEHTVREFLEFCVNGPGGAAGEWTSTFPGKYLDGGKAAGGQLVDQRLLPRIEEGEVRILMAGDTCQMAIHKKPSGGGLSAVGGMSDYTYYKPEDPKYADLLAKLNNDVPQLLTKLDLAGEPLPLLWTADYIPKDPEDPATATVDTEYVVGEFNCSCVGVSMFQAVCGGDKTLADVPDADYFEASKLTDLMGVKACEMIATKKASA